MLKETISYGVLFMIAIAILTLFFPIELYDGVAVLDSQELVAEKLSLSYLVNKQAFIQSYSSYGVVDVKLNTLGWFLVFIVNFGMPLLLGFRVAVARHKKRAQQ